MTQQSAEHALTLASIGIDIGKDVFHIVAFDPGGKVVLRRKIKRLALVAEFKKLPPSIVGMEACLRLCLQAGLGDYAWFKGSQQGCCERLRGKNRGLKIR
jgi:hypothetical protein